MNIKGIAFREPFLTQRQLVEVTEPTNITLDSWVHRGLLIPTKVDKRRGFSLADAIQVDVMHLLVEGFRMRPEAARDLARVSVHQYRAIFEADVDSIAQGTDWRRAGARDVESGAEGFTRDQDGSLRQSREGDDPAASVHVVLPTQLIARRVIHRIFELPDSSAEAEAQPAASSIGSAPKLGGKAARPARGTRGKVEA